MHKLKNENIINTVAYLIYLLLFSLLMMHYSYRFILNMSISILFRRMLETPKTLSKYFYTYNVLAPVNWTEREFKTSLSFMLTFASSTILWMLDTVASIRGGNFENIYSLQ